MFLYLVFMVSRAFILAWLTFCFVKTMTISLTEGEFRLSLPEELGDWLTVLFFFVVFFLVVL